MQEDDVGIRPSRTASGSPGPSATSVTPASSGSAGPGTIPAPPPTKCEALFELFRGGTGSVHLGRMHDGANPTKLVALRRLANLPTRELESAMARAQHVAHPRLTKMLGTYQHEGAWYIASEYASGVTLFELGQTAVRQRTPVAAPVAVRIVLDALTVTAEAEQMLGETAGAARCLYPESVWISDSGKLFMSEILVAPVLARTTTGASYVAVTAGMSAPAADVRAAAVELARLACARLMNGNPASWQTRELPDELSELLAKAITGAPGTETPAAFASALSALPPQLIADREAVQQELERLMGPERLRRREALEALKEKTVDSDTTRVFRAPSAPGVPDFASSPTTVRPPDLGAARARRSTAPPPKPTAGVAQIANPTPTIPQAPLTPPLALEPSDSPISGVWREAHALMGVPGRRRRRATTGEGEHDTMTPAPATHIAAPLVAPVPPAPAATQPKTPRDTKRVTAALLIALALSALLGAAWLVRSGTGSKPSAGQHVP